MINIVQSLASAKNIIYLSQFSKRYAGHSKWSNIKHDKAIKDAKRAIDLNKLCRLISIAITEGNSANPAHNVKLAQVIERAKKVSMPMSTINGLLTKAQATKAQTETGMLEIQGPGGAIIILEYACEHVREMKKSINTTLRKAGWVTCDPGVHYLFERRGIVKTEIQGNLEDATDHAIQVDAEDVREYIHDETKEFHFLCNPLSIFDVKNRLTDLNYTVKSADVQYIPYKRVTLSDEQLENAISLCEKLEARDDIVRLHDNIE